MDGDDGGMSGNFVRGVNENNVVGAENTDEDASDSGSSVLRSMGYVDGDRTTDRPGSESSTSWISTIESIIIAAIAVLLGLSVLYFLIAGILAMLGVRV